MKPAMSVHPRGYGKHGISLLLPESQTGSSPWIRETLGKGIAAGILWRFIPVDTGNTFSLALDVMPSAVHPRGYGKHDKLRRRRHPLIGSSPWIRETRDPTYGCNGRPRFIPVDTGNTQVATLAIDQTAVHPRGYGKHTMRVDESSLSHGSSPWIRETQAVKYITSYFARFIPVDTGNTQNQCHQRLPSAVHPRGYGKHHVDGVPSMS